MNAIVLPPTAPPRPAVPALATVPPLDAILSASGPAFMGVFALSGDVPEPSTLRDQVARAEAFLDGCAAHAAALREAAEPALVDEIERQLGLFVTAWPNASGADLAGYGAQLLDDVTDRRPCRYALRSALRQLRQTSRFLPAIAEVLAALDAAQARVRNTAWHVEHLPAQIRAARADLARAEAAQAGRAAGRRIDAAAAANHQPQEGAPR